MVKHLPTMWETWVQSLGWKISWRRKWQPAPVLLPGKSHGWRSLVGYSPLGRKELDTTEQLHFHFFFQVAQWLRIHLPMQETRVQCLAQEDPWRRKWQPTPAFLPGKSHGWRSLIGYSPWGHKESDMTKRLCFHFFMECRERVQMSLFVGQELENRHRRTDLGTQEGKGRVRQTARLSLTYMHSHV